ncbi:hypothetical protein IEO21_06797 [Rhodonia placenta]|uniref:Threonine/serine exporter-like N-terminal domain-containing protein n=1 Tax=Rhodonia placenta TaxID=104341 RepID=A0A8H7NZB3_9APHY|nr:hypothetical protein IEO21_06797 [Postia placenta]
MDSGSPPRIPSPTQDNRPPGGTRRSGGTKTPRKVQWHDERDASTESTESPRALDEHGLDPSAFETLTDALERHQSSSPASLPRLETVLTRESTSTSSESAPQSEYPSPSHDVPGEAFIDPSETAGLPGAGTERHSQRRKAKWRLPGSATTDTESDVEKSADSPQTPLGPPRHTGVLSALLSLYDANDAASATVGTPSIRSSFDESRPSSGFFPPSRTITQDSMRSEPGRRSQSPSRERTPRWAGSANASVASLTNLRLPKPWGESRPPHTRNGAGVFGPLIASTGNIAGAAAPNNAALAPSIKRPGYHLSRYSLESKMPKVEKPSPTLSRPRSMHFEIDPKSAPEHPSHLRTASMPFNIEGESPSSMRSRTKWTGVLQNLPKRGWSRAGTPSTPGTPATSDEEAKDKEDKARREKRRRKKAEVYITRHVAEIVQRQEFILKLARAMMMFGGPTHRLQAQIQSTAKVLDISLSCMYLPDVMLISFDDTATSTSNIKFIRQGSALDIGKLQDAYALYWKVIHDDISVKDASIDLDDLMRKPQLYKFWQLILIGGFCSASICSVSFNGSFIDSLISFPLGCLLIVIQVFAARNELYSNVFEITVTLLFSFIAAALADSGIFCYTAIGAASIVLILPGFIILCGSLELASRNIVSGAVRVCFSIIYSLFLGFGLSIGATAYSKITHHPLAGANDLTCNNSHDPNGPWYQQTPSLWWAFLTVPLYSLSLSLRNQAPTNRYETLLLVIISCVGWVCNHFTGTKFPNQSDISAAVGGLAVGFISNLYGRFFRNGNAFAVMITGILFQLPSGLANGGLFSFVSDETAGSSSTESYLSGFDTALQLVSVSIGLTVGLGISLVMVHPVQSRRRAGGVFSL